MYIPGTWYYFVKCSRNFNIEVVITKRAVIGLVSVSANNGWADGPFSQGTAQPLYHRHTICISKLSQHIHVLYVDHGAANC